MSVIELFLSGGNIMFPLFFLSILNFALILHLFFEFRLIRKDLSNSKTAPRSNFGQALKEELKTTSDLEKRWEEEFEHIAFSYEKKINWIGNLAGIATLLGLLGTVLGIYSAFQKMKLSGHASPEIFAGGISEALITTIYGLLIAVPSLLTYQYLKTALDEIEILSFKIIYRKNREKK